MSSPNPEIFPNTDFSQWAREWTETFQALRLKTFRQGIEIDDNAVAVVAALIVVADRIDAVASHIT